MIKGIDIGYTYTKDESRNMFKTAYTQTKQIVTNMSKITCNEGVFWVGDGMGTVELDKSQTLLNKLCLLRSLAESQDNEFYIVTGLPISQYFAQKDKLKKFLMQNNKCDIILNDTIEKTIKINDMLIYPQGAGALFSENIKSDVLIVDIGGRTIDIALMEMQGNKHKLQANNTWFQGMLVLYSKIIDEVNKKFDLTLESRYAENILTKGLFIHGKKQDISFLQEVLQEHFEEIFQELRLRYPTKTTPIYLCGGGGHLLYNAFKRRFPDVCMFKAGQFANALGFYNVGVNAFGRFDNKNINRSDLLWQIPNTL